MHRCMVCPGLKVEQPAYLTPLWENFVENDAHLLAISPRRANGAPQAFRALSGVLPQSRRVSSTTLLYQNGWSDTLAS